MSEQHDHEHYRIWFNRLGRGIALVGPSLILLIILATFVTRLFKSSEEAAGPESSRDAVSAVESETREAAPDSGNGDLITTPTMSSTITVAPTD